jgi:hypothetical protein
MYPTPHPEVLARDWLPPVVFGREREVAEVVRRLDPPRPNAAPPWIVGVTGPLGSGTSAVARRAAREVVDRLRQTTDGVRPRLLAVRIAGLRGTHGVASLLLQHLDEGFDGRGFPVAEILAGFLRRLRREGQPLVLVLDDVQVGGPPLAPILKALGEPDRFLPEGEFGIPPVWTLLAGTPEGWAGVVGSIGDPSVLGRPVGLVPYGDRALAAIVRDRAERALGRPPGEGLVARLVEHVVSEGGGAGRALDLLRRELVGGAARGGEGPLPPGLAAPVVEVELRVVRAIEAAARHQVTTVGEVRRNEAALAHAQGTRPLPATTLWRRIVRLERAGYVCREIRPGGEGGTRSILRVLTPVDEWVTASHRSEIRRAAGSWSAPSGPAGSAAEEGLRSESPGPLRPSFDPAG